MRHKVIEGFFKLVDKKQRKFNKQIENRLESITTEVDEFRKAISKLPCGFHASERWPEEETPIPEGTLERISNAFGAEDINATLLIYYLGTSKCYWHTQDDLEKLTGLSGATIEEIADHNPGLIFKGLSQTGNTVYSLSIHIFGFLTAPYYF